MAALLGDCVAVGNGVLPAGVIPPVVTPPTASGIIHNNTLDPIANFPDTEFLRRHLRPRGRAAAGLAADQFGDCIELFDQFWFDHLHILPQRFTLGNVLSTSVNDYEIYNGFQVTKEVNAINDLGFDGIVVSLGPTTPPFDVLARQSEFFELTVSTVGPPQIDASKEYVFTSGESLFLFITGTRVVVFPLPPSNPIVETYAYLSSVHTGLDGTEQRAQLRDVPRLSYEFPYRQVEQIMAFSENQFYEWMGRLWAMPQWVDFTPSTSIVQAPDVTIPVVSTADRDFRALPGDLGVIYDTHLNFEAFEITAVNPTSLDLSAPILGTFPAGSAVMPIRFAFLKGPIRTRPWVNTLRDMDLRFDVLDGVEFGDDFAEFATTYKTLPVWDRDLLLVGLQYDRTFDKRLKRVDGGVGLFDQYQHQDYPVVAEGALFVGENRTEIYDLKRLLMSFQGQTKTVWMQTHREDFTIAEGQDLPSGQPEMRVNIANFDVFLDDNKRTRADIAVTYIDGAVDLREILSSNVSPLPPFETMIVDVNFSQDVSVANVARISYLVKRRLAVDALKFTWTLDEKAQVAVAFLDVSS